MKTDELASPPDPMRILKRQEARNAGLVNETCITTRSDEDTETFILRFVGQVQQACITTRSDEDTETSNRRRRPLAEEELASPPDPMRILKHRLNVGRHIQQVGLHHHPIR